VFTGAHTLIAAERELRFRSAVIATGSEPVVPEIPGLEGPDVVTSDTIWDLSTLPTRLVVLGAGPVGCELGQAFARLGAEVALVDVADRILPREQAEAAAAVAEQLEADGVVIHAATRAVKLRRDDAGAGRLAVEGPAGAVDMPFHTLLVAVGRRVRASGIGLDAAGVRWTRTAYPRSRPTCGPAPRTCSLSGM